MLLEGRLAQGGNAVRLELDGPRITRITAIDAAPELWLAPGLLDIQVNGDGGHDVVAPNVTADTITQLARALGQGSDRFLPNGDDTGRRAYVS